MITIPNSNHITVEIDSREKYPLPFPTHIHIDHPTKLNSIQRIAVSTSIVPLKAGDYRLSEYPNSCIIERKASQRELAKNLLNLTDSLRQGRAFTKLTSSCTHPYIVLELTPAQLLATIPTSPNSYPSQQYLSEQLVWRLSNLTHKYNLNFIFAGSLNSQTSRLKLGTLLLHLMLSIGSAEYISPIQEEKP